MKNQRTISTLLILTFAGFLTGSTLKAQSSIWATAYYAGWQQGYNNSGYMPAQNVDYTAMTHIIHFAAVPQANGTLDDQSNSVTAYNANALVTAAHAAGRKVLICIGGWGSESAFMSATSSGTLSTFVANIVTFMKSRGYDGVDIDWEAISSGDDTQYANFITSLRTALDAVSPRPLLCAATAWEPSLFGQLAGKFDQINLMTYDLAGAWSGWVTWPNSPVSAGGFVFPSTGSAPPSADGMVNSYVAAGVPAGKLGIGIDFYGYVWSGGAGTPAGGATAPRQSWTTAPTVQSNVPYSSIMDTYYQSQYYKWDAATQSAYLSIDNTGSSNDKYITYDDQTTIQNKVNYAKSKAIGGVIVWELGGGYRANQPAGQQDLLLQSLKQALGGSTPPADVTPPTVAVTAPSNGATILGVVTATATASDNIGVVGVQFQTDGANSGTELTAAPYTFSLNTALLTNGSHTISAVARDAAGNKSTATATVTVANVSTDVTPPTVAVTAPVNGSTVTGSMTLSANASDNVAVAGVQFAVDGTNVGSEVATAPYAVSLNSTLYANGSHTVSATARDAAGNKTSSSVNVTVSNSAPVGSSTGLVAYDDVLQTPWIDNSWSATIIYGSTDRAYAGTTSVKVATTSAWGALSIHYGNWGAGTGVAAASYTAISFAVYAPTSGTALTVFAENDAAQTFPQINYGTIPTNQWVVVTIPMSQLNPAGQLIQRVSMQEVSGTTKTFYVDNLQFNGSTVATVPLAPTLSSPATGATGVAVSPTLTWNASTGAASYRLQVSSTSAFSTTLADQSGLTSTSYGLTGLANSTTYYWRVLATNAAGSSNWSAASSFSTASATTPQPAATAVWVYQDAMQTPWIDASWSAAITFSSTEQAYAGSSSIKVVQNAWGALRLHDGSWGAPVAINPALYQSFDFAVHGGTAGVSLGVYFENDNGQTFPAVTYLWVPANQWSVLSFPMSKLNPNNQAINRFVIQDMTGRTKTFYVDNIHFTPVPNAPAQANLQNDAPVIDVPSSFALGQNFPNPFNPSTVIAYDLPRDAHMTVAVYNIVGQQVASLVDGVQSVGSHQVQFDASHLASGVYFYRLTARSVPDGKILFVAAKKMMLTK